MCNIKKTILAAAMATVPFVAGAHDVPLDPHVRDECQPYGRRHVGIDNGCQSRCVRHVAQPRSAS